MRNPNAIVSRYVRLARPESLSGEGIPARGGSAIELEGGRRARLDPQDPRSAVFERVLAGLAELGRPVYLELDPETEAVAHLLIPLVGRVLDVRETGDGYEVELDSSHARHLLRRDEPDFAEIERQLRDATTRRTPVILTEDDGHNIIDIRFFTPGPDDGPLPPFLEEDLPPLRRDRFPLRRIWYWRIWPWRWFYGCVSKAKAQQVFDAMGATTCDPLTTPAPCIPFLYPDDGCWARAHEMCRLMIDMGLSPRKVWIKRQFPTLLHVATKNNPACFVEWTWHVAPTLCVRFGPYWRSWFGGQTQVIDPALFTTPVPVAQWKSVQNDPNATLTYTDASDYQWGATDPTYVKTNEKLAYYRLKLLERSILPAGPPPYANCP